MLKLQGMPVRKRLRSHIEPLERRRLLSSAVLDVADLRALVQDFLAAVVVTQNSEAGPKADASPDVATDTGLGEATVQPDTTQIIEGQLEDDSATDIQGQPAADEAAATEPATEIVDSTPASEEGDTSTSPETTEDPVAPIEPVMPDDSVVTTEPVIDIDLPAGDPVIPVDVTEVTDATDLTDPVIPIDLGTPVDSGDVIEPVIPIDVTDLPVDLPVDLPTDLPEIPVIPTEPIFSDEPVVVLPTDPIDYEVPTIPDDSAASEPTDSSGYGETDLPPVVIDDTPSDTPTHSSSDDGSDPEVVVVSHPVWNQPTPSRSEDSSETSRETTSSQESAPAPVAAAPVARSNEPETTASVRAQANSQPVSTQAAKTTTTGAPVATANPSTATPPAQPAQPAADAPAEPQLAASGADIDPTGQREEQLGQLPGTEEGAKLTRVLWTFLDESPVRQVQVEGGEDQTPAPVQTAAAVIPAVATIEGPIVIQLVQEIDVAPGSAAAAAAAQVESDGSQTIEVSFAQAGMGSSFSDAGNSSRNIVLAALAGATTLGVQWYRASKRKLAAAARYAFDPLGAWLDDSSYPE